MAVDLKRMRFTRADYHRMAQVGIIKPGARVELIDGEIIEMSPIGRRHKASVDRVDRILSAAVGETAMLWIADINRDRVTVYTDPTPDGYATTQVFRRGESMTPLAFPDLTILVEEILG